MTFIIILGVTFYFLFGAMLSGIVDDKRNKSIADGVMNDGNLGVLLCILFWPVLVALFLIITILNIMYLFGKKIKGKWWNK